MHPSGFEPRAQVEHDVHPTGATAPACEAVESGLRRRWGEWRVTHALLLLGDGFSDSEQSLYTAAIGQEAEVAQARHKATAHMTRQRAHRKQIGAASRVPLTRWRQGASGHQAMQVHVTTQILPPGVQHRAHAQLPVQALRIGAERAHRRPHGFKQQRVHLARMHLHPAIEFVRQGEHHVVIGHRQHVRALALAPVLRCAVLALWAMPAAA